MDLYLYSCKEFKYQLIMFLKSSEWGRESSLFSERDEMTLHYKKTHTNITIGKKSNRTDDTKRAIIRGYTDRAKALCDPEALEDELKNIKEVKRI